MYFDLSGFIDYLEAKGELIRVNAYVNPELEIAEITDRVSKSADGGKALLFMNTGTGFPLLINAFGSYKRVTYALGLTDINQIPAEIDELFRQFSATRQSFIEKLALLPALKQISDWFPKVIKTKTPPCREVVMASPKLSSLPILKCWPHDGGRFITLPLVHTKDLETGQRNTGMYRIQVFDDVTTGVHWHKHKTGARHFETYRQAGQLMPVAITLGGDPIYTWCAVAPLPENIDEYIFAGFIRKKAVNLVKCLTQDIEVPADSDIVIEGYIDPAEAFVSEGPFGDHTGFYSLRDLYPKLHVTCVSYRKGAIYPATIVGIPPQEDFYLTAAIEQVFRKPMQIAIAPEICDLAFPKEGVTHNIVIVSIHKTYAGQATKVANALWGAGQMMFCKVLIVVDATVNVRNAGELLNALSKNWTPVADTCILKGPLDVLDHAARQQGFGGKMCIDATEKFVQEQAQDKQTFAEQSLEFCNASKVPAIKTKLTVIFDDGVDVSDFDTCLWLAGNNIDVACDCSFENGSLVVDARAKDTDANFMRQWPNVICMDDATIEAIDRKWDSLGLGRFIPSPSLKYKYLVRSEGAQSN